MGIGQRLAKLEQTQTGEAGDGIIGIRWVDHDTGIGPDVVRVARAPRATKSEAAFQARYPRGILIVRTEYAGRPPGERVRRSPKRSAPRPPRCRTHVSSGFPPCHMGTIGG